MIQTRLLEIVVGATSIALVTWRLTQLPYVIEVAGSIQAVVSFLVKGQRVNVDVLGALDIASSNQIW